MTVDSPAGIDKRPSIRELREHDARRQVPRWYLGDLRRASPALLEIAAAAMAYVESTDEDRIEEFDRLVAALAKFRQ